MTAVWAPEKPESAFTDDEVRQTPDYIFLRKTVTGSDAKILGYLLDMGRKVIAYRWWVKQENQHWFWEGNSWRRRKDAPSAKKLKRLR